MVIFSAIFLPPIPSITKPFPALLTTSLIPQTIRTAIPIRNPRNPKRFVVFAEGINGLNPNEKENGNNGKEEKTPFSNLNWKDLLDPDPENFVAIALTGLLTWAGVQVPGQLLFISLAILVAALKVSTTESNNGSRLRRRSRFKNNTNRFRLRSKLRTRTTPTDLGSWLWIGWYYEKVCCGTIAYVVDGNHATSISFQGIT